VATKFVISRQSTRENPAGTGTAGILTARQPILPPMRGMPRLRIALAANATTMMSRSSSTMNGCARS
jgi:hypothetical protein